jgi:serine/threonine-protein kinase
MAASPDADFIALQTALSGEYSLDREIGRGGMGVVYLAREVSLARPVAIKVLPPSLAARAELRDAFLREAQTAARLNHPNIVPVYAFGERAGFVYMAMAFVDGMTLGERIRTRGPLLPGQAARVLREVAWALAYAHGAKLVHRDVTAENILLERGSERAIVTDFGIASAMQTNALSEDGHVLGNAHYVSPEQAAGEPLDARSDIYSLGVVGYYALTGRLPFDAETSAEVVHQHLTATAPSITSVASSVPPRLASAVEKCLAKEPLRRYRTAESFAEAIDLAFEHAKEIPAPLRVFLSQNDREMPVWLAFVGMGAVSGISLVTATSQSLWFLAPFSILTGISLIPATVRLRRLLREGYIVDDIHAAMREYQLVRAEEIEYERRQVSPRFTAAMRVLFGSSLGGLAIGGQLAWQYWRYIELSRGVGLIERIDAQWAPVLTIFFALCGLTISGVALAGEFVRFRLSAKIARGAIAFWRSKWGARLAKMVGIGIEPADRPVIGMPLLTEIALGRATDHLFQALPKSSRRELAQLPETVRRLETDASKLRASIDALDNQLSIFDRDTNGSSSDEDSQQTRAEIEQDLRATRALAAQRLASTVSALESIRLDLLRLQMGSAGLESVTASLEAAQRVGEQIEEALDAQDEVERILTSEHPREVIIEEEDADDNTPIDGVPATHA